MASTDPVLYIQTRRTAGGRLGRMRGEHHGSSWILSTTSGASGMIALTQLEGSSNRLHCQTASHLLLNRRRDCFGYLHSSSAVSMSVCETQRLMKAIVVPSNTSIASQAFPRSSIGPHVSSSFRYPLWCTRYWILSSCSLPFPICSSLIPSTSHSVSPSISIRGGDSGLCWLGKQVC